MSTYVMMAFGAFAGFVVGQKSAAKQYEESVVFLHPSAEYRVKVSRTQYDTAMRGALKGASKTDILFRYALAEQQIYQHLKTNDGETKFSPLWSPYHTDSVSVQTGLLALAKQQSLMIMA